jgi:predicted nucleotidyltransferase
MLGLSDADLSYIRKTLSRFPDVERAAVFGSRAEGTHKKGSDVDLAVWGETVSFSTIAALKAALQDEGPMPYIVDVVDRTHLEHAELADHIDRVGIEVYRR